MPKKQKYQIILEEISEEQGYSDQQSVKKKCTF